MADSCPYKEWDSLSHLLYLVPEKEQKFGFLPGMDIVITALDVYSSYMIVGTNTAMVYVIDKKKRNVLLRLKCGTRSEDICCISAGSINELYTVVVGTCTGQLYAFKMQPTETAMEMVNSTRAAVANQSCVRSLQLAADCNSAYCGDDSGAVTLLDLRFKQDTHTEPVLLLKESQSIVQLSLCNHLLMISTTSHSLILDLNSKQTTKMGTKPRKISGTFGGCFHGDNGTEVAAFSVRPGLRLWRCTLEGTVLVTHMYKDSVSQCNVIKLQGETGYKAPTEALTQFGTIKMVDSGTLISWTEHCIAFIDISDTQTSALLGISSLSDITGVSCYGGDVYILATGNGKRRLHRLSKTPDTPEVCSVPASPVEPTTPKLPTEADGRGDEELPPIVESADLIALNLNEEHEAATQEDAEQPTAMKKLEAKFTTGFSTVKGKLTVSGDDMKQVGQTVKHGFGSFLTKIQGIAPHRKAHAGLEPVGEAAETPMIPEISVSEPVTDVESKDDTKSTPTNEPALDARSCTDKSDITEAHAEQTPSLVKTRSETLSTEEDEDEADFVTHLAPEKQRSLASLTSSVELTESMRADPSDSSLNYSASPLSNRSSSLHHSDIEASQEMINMPEEDSAMLSDRSLETSLEVQTEAALYSDCLEATHELSLETSQAEALTSKDEDSADDDNDHTSGEELMSRLTRLLSSKTKKEPNFLQEAIQSEEAASIAETGSGLHNEEAGEVTDEEDRISNPASSDSDDEEDIYKPKQVLKDSGGIQFLTSDSKATKVSVAEPSAFAKLMSSEHWSCDSGMSAPAIICAVSNFVWIQDKNSAVWVAKANEPNFIWRKLDIKAHCLSVAPSGCLAWRVYKGTAFAGHCKTRPYLPWSMKWTVAVQGVASVAVDEHCAWYIKINGEVWLQANLSKDRPMKHGTRVPCKHSLTKIVSKNNITWGLAGDGRIYHLSTTDRDKHHWVSISDANNIADLSLTCDGSRCWLIDSGDELWCMTDLSSRQPVNSQQIWQVVYSEGLNADNRQKVLGLFSTQAITASPAAHSIVSASSDIVCVSHSSSTEDINVARTHAIGYRWKSVTLSAFTSSVRWKAVCSMGDGKLVAMYDTGELFYLDINSNKASNVNLPSVISSHNLGIRRIHSCSLSLWIILTNGTVFFTTDIAEVDSIRLGLNWRPLNTCQFANQSIKSVSVGRHAAWAVDTSGAVFLSMGVNAKRQSRLMNPAWISVDPISKSDVFETVYVNDKNSMVWALDIHGYVFARRGVTAELPIGTSWVQVIGIQARELAISDGLVWAVTKDSGQLFCRVGITEQQFQGEFWKRVPASVHHIAVSPNDGVTGLTGAGRLVSLHTKVIGEVKERVEVEQQVDGDWELL